jgi:hypothetical protein
MTLLLCLITRELIIGAIPHRAAPNSDLGDTKAWLEKYTRRRDAIRRTLFDLGLQQEVAERKTKIY